MPVTTGVLGNCARHRLLRPSLGVEAPLSIRQLDRPRVLSSPLTFLPHEALLRDIHNRGFARPRCVHAEHLLRPSPPARIEEIVAEEASGCVGVSRVRNRGRDALAAGDLSDSEVLSRSSLPYGPHQRDLGRSGLGKPIDDRLNADGRDDRRNEDEYSTQRG